MFESREGRVDWTRVALVNGAMLVLGAAVVFGVYAMREFAWVTRPWHGPEVPEARGLPPEAMHARLHTLEVDAAGSDAVVAAVSASVDGGFPDAIRPLAVERTPGAERLLALLRREGRPATVLGPGRCVFRVAESLPLGERHGWLYGGQWPEVSGEAAALARGVEEGAGRAAPGKAVLYALAETPETLGVSFPFEVDAGATFGEAYVRTRTSGRARLLGFHSEVTARGCP